MKCWICNEEATTTRTKLSPQVAKCLGYDREKPNTFRRCYCNECLSKIELEEEAELKEYVRLKKKRMFDSALQMLENQQFDMYRFKSAIDKVEKHMLQYPDKYDSSYEVITAVILVANNIKTIAHQQFGRYEVDFALPDMKVALEIDGDRHTYSKQRDQEKDIYISASTNFEWQVIRINTELLDNKAEKIPLAIKSVIKQRKKNGAI